MRVPLADFQLLKSSIKEQAIEKIRSLTLLSDILHWGPRISARLGHPVQKSCGLSLLSCDMGIRTGGQYRLEFHHHSSEQPMAFFGRYIEVTAPARPVWTNDEGGGAVTTVTLDETDPRSGPVASPPVRTTPATLL